MEYRVGQVLQWVPLWWKWDEKRDVTCERVYPRGAALMSNGVIVDSDGMAMIYGSGRTVGKVECQPSKASPGRGKIVQAITLGVTMEKGKMVPGSRTLCRPHPEAGGDHRDSGALTGLRGLAGMPILRIARRTDLTSHP